VTNPAEAYESYMVPVLFGPWASDLVEAAEPRRGERILDLACGTGSWPAKRPGAWERRRP